MPTELFIAVIASILTYIHTTITMIITKYGLSAIFVLMVLESASAPIPSEVILPLTGLLAARGSFSPYLAFAVVLLAGIIGMGIDYYIAYYVEKKIVYKHLNSFHISKQRLAAFDSWFERNGSFAVFIGRFLPEVRGLVSFPAGFAKMEIKKFFLYSIIGTIIWDVSLMSFGYYALNVGSVHLALIATAIFAIVLYTVYSLTIKKEEKRAK